jgi:hypothetical protein
MDMSSSLKGPLLPSEAEVRISAELARNTAACRGEGATSKVQLEGKEGRSRTFAARGLYYRVLIVAACRIAQELRLFAANSCAIQLILAR